VIRNKPRKIRVLLASKLEKQKLVLNDFLARREASKN
jgi:hypothetical protein